MLTIFAISFISKIRYIYIGSRFILHGICIFKVSLRLKSAVNVVYLLKNHVGGHSIDTRAYSNGSCNTSSNSNGNTENLAHPSDDTSLVPS